MRRLPSPVILKRKTPVMLTYRIDQTRNQLIIEVTDHAAFAEFIKEHTLLEDLQTDNAFIEAIENLLCNGLSTVRPEEIGALTDSIILSEFPPPDMSDHYPDDARFFWFPDYMLRSPLQDLRKHGKVIFDGD
jgi:hypothetical protein